MSDGIFAREDNLTGNCDRSLFVVRRTASYIYIIVRLKNETCFTVKNIIQPGIGRRIGLLLPSFLDFGISVGQDMKLYFI